MGKSAPAIPPVGMKTVEEEGEEGLWANNYNVLSVYLDENASLMEAQK